LSAAGDSIGALVRALAIPIAEANDRNTEAKQAMRLVADVRFIEKLHSSCGSVKRKQSAPVCLCEIAAVIFR
jgi:hypothetical protein